MPTLLSLPRELRDLIYHEVYQGQTSLMPAPGLRKDTTKGVIPPRRLRRFSLDADLEGIPGNGAQSDQAPGTTATAIRESTEPDFYEGEAAVRYSLAEPIPPTTSLLGTNRQLRAEMQEVISRRSVRYEVRIAYREYLGLLYPTWISLPALVSHVDILDVKLRFRHTKTPSIFSTESTGSEMGSGDMFLGGMVLLQRFLERGPFLLGRKRKTKVTVDRMVLSIEPKDFQSDQEAEEYHSHTVEWFDDLFWPDEPMFPQEPSSSRRDELLPLFAECIRVFECRQGHLSKEWPMAEVGMAVERRLARRRGS